MQEHIERMLKYHSLYHKMKYYSFYQLGYLQLIHYPGHCIIPQQTQLSKLQDKCVIFDMKHDSRTFEQRITR